MKEQHTRTVWVVAENEEEASQVERNLYWIFPSAEEAWKMIRIPGNAERIYRCRPFQVTITVTTSEAPLSKTEADDLMRKTKERDEEFRRQPPEAK